MSESGKKNKFVNKPYYQGGNKALDEFIKKHLVYPKEAISESIEGQVQLLVDIDYKGNVVKAKVKKSIGHGCDEEAIRIAKLVKFHVEVNKGLRVTFHKTLNIQFKLPTKKRRVTYSYQITSTTDKIKSSVPSSGTTYSYTIKKK